MAAPSREDKLERVLNEFVGQWVDIRAIYEKLQSYWRTLGFASARSLGLYMRRFKFDKDGGKYFIEKEKIIKGIETTNKWKRVKNDNKGYID